MVRDNKIRRTLHFALDRGQYDVIIELARSYDLINKSPQYLQKIARIAIKKSDLKALKFIVNSNLLTSYFYCDFLNLVDFSHKDAPEIVRYLFSINFGDYKSKASEQYYLNGLFQYGDWDLIQFIYEQGRIRFQDYYYFPVHVLLRADARGKDKKILHFALQQIGIDKLEQMSLFPHSIFIYRTGLTIYDLRNICNKKT